eukprot:g17496.t1
MIRRILPTNDWDHDRDVAASALAAHQFSPPWAFPTVNELRCKLGHGCAGSGPLKTAAERVEEAAQQEAKIEAAKMAMKEYDENGKPKGPPGWPLGVRSYDKTAWISGHLLGTKSTRWPTTATDPNQTGRENRGTGSCDL